MSSLGVQVGSARLSNTVSQQQRVRCPVLSPTPAARTRLAPQVAGHVPRRHDAAVQASETTTAPSTSGNTAPGAPGTPPRFDINERVEFLRNDLQHLFDDTGIDAGAYDTVVEFRDPITKYSSLQGYLFNIAMLRRVFQPVFELHDITPVSPYAITTRWTMTMSTPVGSLPGVNRFWNPTLIFTGTSTYCFNPANGKINKHIDTWDSISNQAFFSVEAFGDFWRQLLATYTMPEGLETPAYTVLRRASDYQVRRYRPFLVASTPLDAARAGASGGADAFNPASTGYQAFNSLARFIFGGNEAGQKMAMTTPVYSDTQGTMQFVIGPSAHKDLSTVPQPLPGAQVTTREEPGGVYAVRVFGGLALEQDAAREAAALRASLNRDGVQYEQEGGWKLARYNDPGTLPPFRRNEVLIALAEPYELWRPGELDSIVKEVNDVSGQSAGQ